MASRNLMTDEIRESIRKQFLECDHSVREIRSRKIETGHVVYQAQCIRCGDYGHPIAKEFAAAQCSGVIDDELRSRHYQRYRNEVDRVEDQLRAQWWADYHEHLASDEWALMRSLVIERCGNVCEGCGMRKVDDVHHRTYRHVCEEFLFELVGLCSECHQRIHDKN